MHGQEDRRCLLCGSKDTVQQAGLDTRCDRVPAFGRPFSKIESFQLFSSNDRGQANPKCRRADACDQGLTIACARADTRIEGEIRRDSLQRGQGMKGVHQQEKGSQRYVELPVANEIGIAHTEDRFPR